MPPIDVVLLLILATNQAVEIWRHGSIMAGWRMRVDIGLPLPLVPDATQQFLRDLLRCSFCLSVWVAALIYVLWHIGHVLAFPPEGSLQAHSQIGEFLGFLCLVPIYTLAISRAANILNDLCYNISRTPNRSSSLVTEDVMEEIEEPETTEGLEG